MTPVLLATLVVTSPIQLGLSATAGYAQTTEPTQCFPKLSCDGPSAQGLAASFGAFALYRLRAGGVGVRGETILIPGSDNAASFSGLIVGRAGNDRFAELGLGPGWTRVRRGDKRGTHVGLAIDLGLGLFVAEHVALTVRGALITGVLGLGSITAGAEVVF